MQTVSTTPVQIFVTLGDRTAHTYCILCLLYDRCRGQVNDDLPLPYSHEIQERYDALDMVKLGFRHGQSGQPLVQQRDLNMHRTHEAFGDCYETGFSYGRTARRERMIALSWLLEPFLCQDLTKLVGTYTYAL